MYATSLYALQLLLSYLLMLAGACAAPHATLSRPVRAAAAAVRAQSGDITSRAELRVPRTAQS